MKNLLEDEGFHLASLGSNMRNTREISKVQLRHDENTGLPQAKAYISKLKSSVTGKTPTHIPIFESNGIKYTRRSMSKLKQALNDVLNSDRSQTNESWVILHDFAGPSSTDIGKLLNEIGRTDISVYHKYQTQEKNDENLRNFLSGGNKILVTESKYFTGCEARNILYIFSNQIHTYESPRSALLRAVENLVCISFVNEFGIDRCRFDGFLTDVKYLDCENTSKKLISRCMFECLTCELESVCNCCRNACHTSHEVIKRTTNHTSHQNCICNTKMCKIQPSEVV